MTHCRMPYRWTFDPRAGSQSLTTKLNVSRIMVIDDEVAQNDIEKVV